LDAEIDDVERLGINLETFLGRAKENPINFLSLEPLFQFQREGGELKQGQLLSAYPPFIAEKSADGVSLRAISMFDRLGFPADFARQVTELPKETKIRFKVENPPEVPAPCLELGFDSLFKVGERRRAP
jgi:hypothetical protein